MRTIYTVQHTQSVHHTNGMVGSWTDWDLTDFGLEQARLIAKHLQRELNGRKATLYTSDLKRARQTAEPIAAALNIEPILRTELRERCLGSACGQSVQWLREHMTAPERTVDDRLFPDAESRRDAWDRLTPFFDALMASKDDPVVVVSHGDLLGTFTAMFLGLKPESLETADFRGAAGGVSCLTVTDDGRHVLRRFSDFSWRTDA